VIIRARMVNRTDIIASLGKGLAVIECFGPEAARLSVSQVAELAGLDRAAARRCLLTLQHLGYASYDGKYFALTPRVLRLGAGALAALPLSQMVQPWLDQLSENTGQSCSVSILDNTDIVYIARAAQRRVMSIGLLPGSRLPSHCTSMGRVLLAALKDDEAARLISASDLTPRTQFSRTDPDEILQAVRQARVDGFAIITEEVEVGLTALAVPIRDSRSCVVAALNVGMSSHQATSDDLRQTYLPELLKVQKGLASILT